MVALSLLVATTTLAPAAAGIASASTSASTSSTAAEIGPASGTITPQAANVTGPYGYQYLSEPGPSYGGLPGHVRLLGEHSTVALEYEQLGLFGFGGIEVNESVTVRDDEVTLRGFRIADPDTFDQTEFTVTVVYWDKFSTTREEGNETVPVTHAANQTVKTHKIDLDQRGFKKSIPLAGFDGETRRVTVFIEGVDGAKWTFSSKQNPYAQAVNIDSEGDFWQRAILLLVVPTLATTSAAGYGVPRLMKSAAAGPGYGVFPYLLVGGFLLGALLLGAWVWLGSILVSLPLILPLVIGVVVGIIFLENYEDDVFTVQFIKVDGQETQSPGGNPAFDGNAAATRTLRLTRTSDGQYAVVSRGLIAFFARLFGGKARLHEAHYMKSVLDLYGAGADALVFVDPDSPRLVHVEPEHFEWDSPFRDDEGDVDLAGTLGFLGMTGVAFAAGNFAVGPLVGILVAIPVVGLLGIRAVEGYAEVDAAAAHERLAVVNAMVLEEQRTEYAAFEDVLRALRNEKNRSEEIRELIQETGAEALIEAANDRGDSGLGDIWKNDDTSAAENRRGGFDKSPSAQTAGEAD
jgi:hypothetical protein